MKTDEKQRTILAQYCVLSAALRVCACVMSDFQIFHVVNNITGDIKIFVQKFSSDATSLQNLSP